MVGMVDSAVDTVEDLVEDTVEVGKVVAAVVDTGEYMVELACCAGHKDLPSFYHCSPRNPRAAAGSAL